VYDVPLLARKKDSDEECSQFDMDRLIITINTEHYSEAQQHTTVGL